MASLAETEEGEDDVCVGAERNVAGALNAEAVELRRDVGPGNQGLHVVRRHGGLRDVDDAREEGHRVESGRRPVARCPRCAPAVHGLNGGATPNGTIENRAFGENEGPLGGEGGVGVECDTNVAGGARHSGDVDEGDEVRRDVYEKRVDCECVTELDIESNAKRAASYLSRARTVHCDEAGRSFAAGVKGNAEQRRQSNTLTGHTLRRRPESGLENTDQR
ncbi:hypothetical protein EDB84DRAFT_1506687 [Lactarius hengduanensis]|nr:hypothetical protein EDB84DRAFT_1506687 [Lactarius hengduanensis]